MEERDITMADSQSVPKLELVRSTVVGEHGDFLKEAAAAVAAELIEGAISADRRAAG